jgi:decaprenylphospho-beta-D-ribofuranose 2-oxidase
VTLISSFDGTEAAAGELTRAARGRALEALTSTGPVIPRGSGLSYCNASAGAGVRSVSCERLDRILDLDAEAGAVEVESGVRVGQLTNHVLARGWLLPTLPGHPAISVGGCVGFNVHGKDHRRGGNFIRCVEALQLLHPDHGEIECSRSKEPELFELSVGGFGLTGFVTRVKLRLEPLQGSALCRERLPARNLREAVEIMEARREDAALYSWNDLNRRGDAFGRGVVYAERFVDPGRTPEPKAYRRLRGRPRPLLPWSILGRWNAAAFTRSYGALERLRSDATRVALPGGLFPIHGKEVYFRLFGRRGLREYQMLLPRSAWEEAVGAVERLLVRHRAPVTLGSLKLFAGETTLLNFCGTGVCLTLDLPARPGSELLFAELDELVVELGGIVNLCKDGRIGEALVRRVFPEYERFRERLQRFDPKRRFDSSLRRRIGV